MSRGTKAFINLNHLQSNYKTLKNQSKSKLVLVVKADAYGHGLKQVVESLGVVDCYAVATLGEAKIIRSILPKARILLLEGFLDVDELSWAQENKIDCVIHNFQQIELLKGSSSTLKINIWLKIDSGMNRLGFPPKAFEQTVKSLELIKPKWQELVVMSHFSNADDASDAFNSQQEKIFFETANQFNYPISFKNTSALLNQFAFEEDWSRVGIGLYGVSPIDSKSANEYFLKPVMSLVSNIIELKTVQKGSGVGYGQSFIADRDMKVAILGIGYGDGYPWMQCSSTEVSINGAKASVIGRVSMDMMAVDVSHLNDVLIGQEVLIWGESENNRLPVESVAQKAKTIPYVLLCGLTSRVEFNYIE